MRIGFDIDGVLAAFIPAYEKRFEHVTGRNTFPPLDPDGPPTWDWPSLYGYTKDETRAVWKDINADPLFWATLGKTGEFADFRKWYDREMTDRGRNELYFITSRPGTRPKHQTEEWFCERLLDVPTVLISDEKGLMAKALNLDFYVDDKLENILAVEEQSPTTYAYLLDRRYNRHGKTKHRIGLLAEFLQVVDSHQLATV